MELFCTNHFDTYLSGLNFEGSEKCSGSFIISPINGISTVPEGTEYFPISKSVLVM